MRTLAVTLTLIAVLALAGCGRSGPLYLPDDDGQTQNDTESE